MQSAGRGLRLRSSLGIPTTRQQQYGKRCSPGQWPWDGAGVGPLLGLLPQAVSRSWALEKAGLGEVVTETPAKASGAEHAGRQGFTGQGTRRAAWPVIPRHSAKFWAQPGRKPRR